MGRDDFRESDREDRYEHEDDRPRRRDRDERRRPVEDDDDEASGSLGKLGSLAQSARLKHLNTARWILILVGILLVGWHSFELATLRDQVNDELRKKNLVVINQAEFEKALQTVRLVIIGAIALGVVFIILGVLVKTFPVPVTILGLVLYLVYTVGAIIINPANAVGGIVIKIFIIVGLIKAIQAGIAYQKDERAAARRRSELGYE